MLKKVALQSSRKRADYLINWSWTINYGERKNRIPTLPHTHTLLARLKYKDSNFCCSFTVMCLCDPMDCRTPSLPVLH